jgi:DNA polymerase V
MELFDTSSSSRVPLPSSLYKAVDALNARYGKGKVFSAAEGIGKKSWHMKRQKLSPRPTTRWDELMVVR